MQQPTVMIKRALTRGLLLMVLILGLMGAWTGKKGHAHPHAYIDVKITAVFGDGGRLVALHHHWTFDRAYTAFALFDQQGSSPKNQQQKLDEIMAQNLTELRHYDFFTEIKQADQLVSTGVAVHGKTQLVDQQIEMTFTLPVTGAADDQEPLTYYVFDPTYYIQMRHDKQGEAVRITHPSKSCAHELIEPTPTVEQTLFAANLGINVTGPPDLGRLFTQTVTITCDSA
ncbi:MAG: DUF1007 family protein [Pseudomonadota bacterium]